jgi:outer membrane protein
MGGRIFPRGHVQRLLTLLALSGLVAATEARAQERLTLEEAIGRALDQSASLSAAVAAFEAKEAGRDQARAALLPRVDFTESFTRSDNPVFVFGSLLNQGHFTGDNFDLDRLNHPDPLSLFQSQFRLRQVLFDRQVFLSHERAGLGAEMASEAKRQAEMETIFATVRAYHGVQVGLRNLAVLEDAVEAARSDVSRADALYDAGQVTDADRLALSVHLADLTEQRIRARNTVEIMRSELNRITGQPLDIAFELTTSLVAEEGTEGVSATTELETVAAENSPIARQSELKTEMAAVDHALAQSSFLPSVRFNAGWESDRVSFTGAGGTNWMLGVAVDINLFDGLGKVARVRAADAEKRRSEAAERDAMESLRLEVRKAVLDRTAAVESMVVARESVEQARESHRITEARYEGGLATVTDLLRSQNALLGAEARHLGALYQARLAAVRLALVTGTLHRDAEVLKP